MIESGHLGLEAPAAQFIFCLTKILSAAGARFNMQE